MSKIYRMVAAVLLLQVTGCTLSPVIDRIDTGGEYDDRFNQKIPQLWRDGKATAPKWRELILSEQLEQLIQQAINANQNLLSQQAQWRAAVERTRVARADLWPNVSLSLNSTREEALESRYVGEINVSWELDTWGKLSSIKHASLYNEKQQEQVLQWVKYSLAADVARVYVNLISQKQQWLLAQQREQSLRQSLQIIEDGYHAGIREALDVYSARAELTGGQADVIGLQREYSSQLKDLLLLLGQMPDYPLVIPDELPLSAADFTGQIGSDLLARRPDVREALYKVYEQQAQVNVAKANRFPQFTLGADYGDNSDAFSSLYSGDDIAWNFLTGITAPVFNAGKLAAEQRAQQETLVAQVANFRQVLLNAVKEAQQRLDDQYLIQQQLVFNELSVTVSDQAEQQAFERYIAGIENLNTWLQAQRTAFQRRTQLVSLQSELIQRRIDLHLAVGGDFSQSTLPYNRLK